MTSESISPPLRSAISSQSDYDRVLIYHDATKHHPHRYAKSLGYLDWANQPDPFRRYDGAPRIELVVGPRDGEPAYDALFRAGEVAPQPLNRWTLSEFFECSLGLSAWKSYKDSTWALRCNPSSGNLHPTEGYLICGPVAGIGDQAGVYHYSPKDHVLESRHSFSPLAWDRLVSKDQGQSDFLVGLTSIFWREAWKYGERAFRYCQHDVGHAIAALRFSAAMLGWRLGLVDIADKDLLRLLGLDRINYESRVEWEHAELLAVVSSGPSVLPASIDSDVIEEIEKGQWHGTPNRLSAEHVEWDIIDMVADATYRLRETLVGRPTKANCQIVTPTAFGARTDGLARQIILRRRSATDFDGETRLLREDFYRMMRLLLPGAYSDAVPWDTISWSPRIHLLMFVHLVDGLPPGLYAFVRDRAKIGTLRAATKPDFEWSRPAGCPDDLDLFFLMEADCRRAAAQLSLGQAIGGTSAFSFGMVAEFEASLKEFGPWFYRRLFWEAGMVGQTLYLQAEAAAIRDGNHLRATGIGAYFDDPVHEVFGLTGHAFQDLYHFTIGGAVEDTRLTTRPPYDKPICART